jgi:hypothetical protein
MNILKQGNGFCTRGPNISHRQYLLTKNLLDNKANIRHRHIVTVCNQDNVVVDAHSSQFKPR